MIELSLPYPPSVNRYYRNVGRRTLISREGRQYRKDVCSILAAQSIRTIDGPVGVIVELYPPDRRRRDADNAMKALADSIEHAGVYHDDSQIVALEVHKHGPVAGGQAVVVVGTHEEYRRLRRRGSHELVCCAGCGRDTFRPLDALGDAYCSRCIKQGRTHAFPEDRDRVPLGVPECFAGHDGDPGLTDSEF